MRGPVFVALILSVTAFDFLFRKFDSHSVSVYLLVSYERSFSATQKDCELKIMKTVNFQLVCEILRANDWKQLWEKYLPVI